MSIKRFQLFVLGVAAACGLLIPSAATAALSITNLGASTLAPSGVLGDFAFDDKHDVYLHVWEYQSLVWGRFIGADGTVLGTTFVVSTHVNPGGFGGRPRVAYSRNNAGIDEFLVVYASDFNATNTASNVFGQFVRFTGTGATQGALIGSFITMTPSLPGSALLQNVNAVAFNSITGRFLVSWEEVPASGYEVVAQLYAADGTPAGAAVNVSASSGAQGVSRIAFDPQLNRFLITYVGDLDAASGQLGTFARLLDGNTAAPLTGLIPVSVGTAFVLEPDVTYLPQRSGFLVTWTMFKPDRAVAARFVPSATGALSDPEFLALDTLGADGGASLAYDPASSAVLIGAMSDPKYIRGAILNGSGVPLTAAFVLGTVIPTNGSFYPAVRPAKTGIFGLSYVTDYTSAVFERFRIEGLTAPCSVSLSSPSTSANGGGGTGSVGVTASACSWTAVSNSSWITVTGGASGTGNGTVSFAVAPNNGPARSGGISIGDQTFTITQSGCTFSISPPAITLPAGGGQNLQFNVTASAGCTWTAQSSVNWIATSSTGTGNGTVLFTAVRNATPLLRGGQISVGGLYFLVYEAGATVNDLNDDGRPDILFQNTATGGLTTWSMNIAQQVSSTALPSEADVNWRVVGEGDMNRDGQSDIIWRHNLTGAMRVWLMDGPNIAQNGEQPMTGVSPGNWFVVGAGDFDRDGTPDIVWQDDSNGDVAIWLIQQANDGSYTFKDTRIIARVGTSWKIRGVADFNRDNIPDLVFQDISGGWLAVWFMGPSGQTVRDTRYFTLNGVPQRVDPNWRIVGAGDFNNDLRADLVWQHIDGWLAMWLTWDNFVLDTRYLTNSSGTPIRFTGLNLNWRIVGPR